MMERYDTVFSLLKTALWGAERYPLVTDGTEDWEKAYKELTEQAAAGLVTDVMGTVSGLDPQLKRLWMQNTTRKLTFWNKLMKEQDALKGLLDEADIPFVILKGAAAAMYYPQPEYRAMGDVDLIVRPQDFERAKGLMLDSGYRVMEGNQERHAELSKNGILFELHRYFSTTNDWEVRRETDRLIFDAIGSHTERIGPYSFPALPRFENGIVLLTHINQHLEAGLGLRQILDWMLYVDRELDDERWDREFAPWADHAGLKTLAVTVTRMCQIYLGLREDGIGWCMDADESLCADLMELIMERGNFGRKKGGAGPSVSILSAMSKITNIPKLLQKRGRKNWKALEKYPFLEPFAWLYQLCRYIKKGLSQELPFRQLAVDIRQMGRQDQILTRLGVTRRLKDTISEKPQA